MPRDDAALSPDPAHGAVPALTALAFGPFVLNRAAGQLLRQGQPVDLAPRPWSVLVYLVEREGRLVSKDDLLDAVWGHRHVSDSVLKGAINSVRSRLGDDPAAPQYIETAARRGYRFIAPVTALAQAVVAAVPAPAPTPAPAQAPESPPPPPQAADPGTGAMSDPTAAPAALGNLPAATAVLVGREAAMAELRGLLGSRRLVTLLGPGGVGKTQLALATAQLDPPPDGVWLVRLEALADATALLDTVARALSLGGNAGRSVQDLAHALSPLAMRIVLDNAEHLIDALAPWVAECLAQAPRVQILVTSQMPLRVAGEVLMPLQPLDVPPAGSTASALGFSAVALLVERVRAMQPQFVPDTQECQDIAALCRLLDGLPLALELAAARVPLLGTAGVLARMSDRFALLSRGARDASQRHRTLRDALAWSFGLLGADELRVLRRLSVFAGTFTPAMAVAVAQEPGAQDWQVLDALQNLQDQNLIATDSAHGMPRLRQLESVRALAGEHLRSAGEEALARTRMAEAMLDLFQAAQARYTRTPLLHWLQPLRPEADNLRLALSHALSLLAADDPAAASADNLQRAVALFSHAMLFWLRSGRKREAQRAFEALAPHAPRINDHALRAAYGLAVGALAAYGQSLPPADGLPWLEEAEQSFVRLGDGRSAMLAVYLQAALLQRMAPTADRTPLLARMRTCEQPDWSLRERNFAAWTEAVNAHGHGDLLAFRDFCIADLARARAGDDHAEAWVAAYGLGQALWSLGDRAGAVTTLADAVDSLRSAGLLREYATTAALAASMRLALDEARPQAADSIAAVREAADLMSAEGMLWWMGDALMMLPAHRGEWPAALCLQAWIDARMQALGMKRSPVASSLRERFGQLLDAARAQSDWREPDPVAPGVTDDATVLRLAFG